MSLEDDPFAVFGESEEEEEDQQETSSTIAWASQTLAAQANERMAQRKDKESNDDTMENEQSIGKENHNTTPRVLEPGNSLELWPTSPPPLYLGSIRLASCLEEYGGGRGYVATRALEPGTLVLVEEPMITWPTAQLGKALDLVSVQHILQHESAQDIVRDIEDFHPTKQAVDNDKRDSDIVDFVQIHQMMQTLQQEQDEDRLQELVQTAKHRNISNRNGEPLSTRDIVRLLLALRYNGLETGVYRHVAMLNHNCHFNCVKYQPTEGKSYSEVRTTRPVAAGEALTISYLPRSGLASHATRRRHLWDQHRFDIGEDNLLRNFLFMELVNKTLPLSYIDHVDEATPTFRIESACLELENMHDDLSLSVSGHEGCEQMRALELSALELYTEAKKQLQNDQHLLLIWCLKIHLDTSSDILEKDAQLTFPQRIKLLLRVVATARTLVSLQVMFYGKDHFDVARTNLDLTQTIEELLGRAPKQLATLGLDDMATFEECSVVEHEARKEYDRIQALYPHDVEQHIQSQTQN